MRILHLTDNLDVGGSQLVLAELANGQARAGHVVGVAAGAGALWPELDPSILRYEHSGDRLGRRRLIPTVQHLLRAQPWDIVHTHQRGVSTAVWLLKRVHPLVHVEHVHAVFPVGRAQRISFRGDALVACGSAVAHSLISDYGRAPEKVHTIPNGVPDHGVRRTPLPSTTSPLRVLNIGRVDHVKDPERFIRVVVEANRLGTPVHATWIGDGPLLGEMRDLVRELNASDLVTFPGGRRPAVSALADSDVFLLTSVTEGLPLSVIEASAAGCAVIAPEVGSLGDVIRDGHSGWLFDRQESASHVAQLLGRAWSSPDLLTAVGERARETFEDSFEFSRMSRRIDDLYQELTASKSAAH